MKCALIYGTVGDDPQTRVFINLQPETEEEKKNLERIRDEVENDPNIPLFVNFPPKEPSTDV